MLFGANCIGDLETKRMDAALVMGILLRISNKKLVQFHIVYTSGET